MRRSSYSLFDIRLSLWLTITLPLLLGGVVLLVVTVIQNLNEGPVYSVEDVISVEGFLVERQGSYEGLEDVQIIEGLMGGEEIIIVVHSGDADDWRGPRFRGEINEITRVMHEIRSTLPRYSTEPDGPENIRLICFNPDVCGEFAYELFLQQSG